VVPRTVKINIQKSIKEVISKYRAGGGGFQGCIKWDLVVIQLWNWKKKLVSCTAYQCKTLVDK
jgi:hypothetical protein